MPSVLLLLGVGRMNRIKVSFQWWDAEKNYDTGIEEFLWS